MRKETSMWSSEKKMVLQAAQQMAAKGLVVATAGNVSVRLGEHGDRELLLSRLTGAVTTHCTLMVWQNSRCLAGWP